MKAMKCAGRLFSSLAVGLICVTSAITQASAAIVFSDNFETYTPSSNLIGQGGWVAPPFISCGPSGCTNNPSVVTVATSAVLPTNIIDGWAHRGPSLADIATHPILIEPNTITILTFDAYAFGGDPFSKNSLVGFSMQGEDNAASHISWFPNGTPGPFGVRQWDFLGPNGNDIALGGYDKPVRLGVVLDGVANEVYGLYDFGGGFLETSHQKVAVSYEVRFNELRISNPHATPGWSGIQVDNLVVTSIPEPTTATLLGVGIALVVALTYGSRRVGALLQA